MTKMNILCMCLLVGLLNTLTVTSYNGISTRNVHNFIYCTKAVKRNTEKATMKFSRHSTLSAIPIKQEYTSRKSIFPLVTMGNIHRLGSMLIAFLASFLLFQKKALASTAPVLGKIVGWDLFGRVPHDEWLFTNKALTSPDLLKRTFLEAVTTELPIVLGNLQRRKRVKEIARIFSGIGYGVLVVVFCAIAYKGALAGNLRRLEKNDRDLGITRKGYGAITKKGMKKGTEIDGMNGWIDMDDSDKNTNNKDDKKTKPSDEDYEDDDDEDDDDVKK
mmetsp:Transcript_708/g.817  ORF Transcript_708/g.817 Transcript_708/m.817 type:complete len:275 (+) Transcript_708:121-945(+)